MFIPRHKRVTEFLSKRPPSPTRAAALSQEAARALLGAPAITSLEQSHWREDNEAPACLKTGPPAHLVPADGDLRRLGRARKRATGVSQSHRQGRAYYEFIWEHSPLYTVMLHIVVVAGARLCRQIQAFKWSEIHTLFGILRTASIFGMLRTASRRC